jgi:hypothetical protein
MQLIASQMGAGRRNERIVTKRLKFLDSILGCLPPMHLEIRE